MKRETKTKMISEDVDPELYYIQNVGTVGNSMRWWKPDGKGYTSNLDQAWKVSLDEARRICKSRPQEDFPHPVSKMDALAERHVDIQKVRKAGRL